MNTITEKILAAGNLYFILIIGAAIFINYLIVFLMKAITANIDEKKANKLWIINIVKGPFMILIINAGYGFGYSYLELPLSMRPALGNTTNILWVINLGWLAFNSVHGIVVRLFKAVPVGTIRFINFFVICIWTILIFILFRGQYIALLIAIAWSVVFIFVIQKFIVTVHRPAITKKVVIPKRLIMTHIYLASSETDEAVARALKFIKEAIQEVKGTEDNPRATLSGFTKGGFDILIKYFVIEPENMEQIKERVNLNIIKLNQGNIKLSTA
jgi:hypothetical protein